MVSWLLLPPSWLLLSLSWLLLSPSSACTCCSGLELTPACFHLLLPHALYCMWLFLRSTLTACLLPPTASSYLPHMLKPGYCQLLLLHVCRQPATATAWTPLLLHGHPCYCMDTPATAWTPLLLHGHRCYCLDTAATACILLLPGNQLVASGNHTHTLMHTLLHTR